jgi:hypothetical protein
LCTMNRPLDIHKFRLLYQARRLLECTETIIPEPVATLR